jgi:hypothetical protein
MKKIKNISLIVLSIALLGLWSCNKAQSVENTASESQKANREIILMSAIYATASNDEVIANAGLYDEIPSLFQPWTSSTLAP